MSPRKAYAWITVSMLVGLVLLAVVSCQAPAPTPTSRPEPTSPPAPTSPPSPPTPTAVPPTVAPTAAPTKEGSAGLELVMFDAADFSGSGTCSLCHDNLWDEAGNNVSITSHWRSTIMANAAKDPYYLAKTSSEIVHHPELQEALEDVCVVCHMPMARTQAMVDGSEIAMFGDGFLSPDNALNEAALDGVSCTLCHQVEDKGLGAPETFTGNFVVDTSTEPPERKVYGPFDEQYEANMRALVGYVPLFGEQSLDAGLCAACHTLYTPYFDDAGKVLGQFPEQTIYLEWQHSAYAQMGTICQTCHMPAAQGEVAISNRPNPPKIVPREPFAQHHFVGANAFMIELYLNNVEELGLTCSSDDLEDTLARVQSQVAERSMSLVVSDAELSGDALSFSVRLTNRAGHKFPGGFPARRAWLHVTVADSTGKQVLESGKPRIDGTVVGCDADDDAASYERHRDVISEPDQVQIYESIMGDRSDRVTYTLLNASHYLKDNRILPLGFDKASARADIAVHGLASVDEDFGAGSDDVTYQIGTQGFAGPFSVTVELMYQSIAHGFIRDFRQYTTAPVQEFLAYHDAAENLFEIVASVSATVG